MTQYLRATALPNLSAGNNSNSACPGAAAQVITPSIAFDWLNG